MTDAQTDEFQDIHDALGIQPFTPDRLAMTSSVLREMQSAPGKIASGVGNALGVNDALSALRGQMTPEEAQYFALTSAAGLLPMGKAERAGELAWSAVKPVIEDAWKAGQPPTGALVDYLGRHVLNPFKHIAENYPEYDNFLDKLNDKYGDWTDIMHSKFAAIGKGVTPADVGLSSLSDEAIEKHLAKNPGASLAEVAGLKGQNEFPLYPPKQGRDLRSSDFSKYITPIESWQDQLSTNTPRVSPLEFESVEARERARQQGYNVDLPLFKGGHWSSYQNELHDPRNKSWEPGAFFSDDPEVAHKYTSPDSYALPFVARAHNPMEVHWPTATGLDDYNSGHMNAILHTAKQKGADLVVVRDVHEMGGVQDQYVVLDPKIVRQPGAEFDPSKMNLAKLAAGVGGLSAAGAAAQSGETK